MEKRKGKEVKSYEKGKSEKKEGKKGETKQRTDLLLFAMN